MGHDDRPSPKERARAGALYEVHGDKLRFLIAGAWNTAFSYGLFVGALAVLGGPLGTLASSSARPVAWLGEHAYLIVQWLTWVVAVVQSTATMKYLVFRRPGDFGSQVRRAYLIYLPAQGLSSLILWLSVTVVHLAPQVGQLIAIAVTTVVSYLGHKYFTFALPAEAGGVLDDAPE